MHDYRVSAVRSSTTKAGWWGSSRSDLILKRTRARESAHLFEGGTSARPRRPPARRARVDERRRSSRVAAPAWERRAADAPQGREAPAVVNDGWQDPRHPVRADLLKVFLREDADVATRSARTWSAGRYGSTRHRQRDRARRVVRLDGQLERRSLIPVLERLVSRSRRGRRRQPPVVRGGRHGGALGRPLPGGGGGSR